MNIHDPGMMPPVEEVPAPTQAAWKDLFDRRAETFQGFAEIEARRGFQLFPHRLDSPRGQDVARLLMFRGLEEITESIEADGESHKLEELIDAINYFMSVFMIHPELTAEATQNPLNLAKLADTSRAWPGAYHGPPGLGDEEEAMGSLAYVTRDVTKLTDHFRNRAWMKNAQDFYFSALQEFIATLLSTILYLHFMFSSWEEFWRFFIAKDNVLKFRLRTGY